MKRQLRYHKASKNFRKDFQNFGQKFRSFFFYILYALFYKNNFIRLQGGDFAQSWGKIKINLRTFEAETLKILQKS